MLLLCSTDRSMAGGAARRVAAELADRLRVDLSGIHVGDPSPRLLAAAHATGCDVLVVGYALRAGLEIASTPGWQRRVVRDTLCPAMLVPAGATPLGRSGLMLGCSVLELPRQAATTVGRLAGRLQTPLILTDVLAGAWTRQPNDRPSPCTLLGQTAEVASVAGRCDAYGEHPSGDRASRAVMQEAALVVVAGRCRGRGLLPRRHLGQGRLHASSALPAIVTVTPAGTPTTRR
jgi:hypothetical protein